MRTISTLRANARRVFFFSLLILVSFSSYSQIFFQNPDMEGVPISDTPPHQWSICSWTPDTQPLDCCPWFLPAFSGKTYLGIQQNIIDSTIFSENVCQFLNCKLLPNRIHHFNVHLYNMYGYQYGFDDSTVFQLYGGNNFCEMDSLLWQSPILDSVWHQYEVLFTPNLDYSFLCFSVLFLGSINHNIFGYIGIDDLSEITVDSYNFFSFQNTDTTINKGACVSFTASSDDTSATFYWSTTAGDSVATADSINVCPTSTTTYICTATLGCGQQFKDSVTITVLGGGSSGIPIIKIPNLLSADNPTWQIINLQSGTSVTVYNTLGQLVYKNKEYNNTLNINTLAAATYFYEVKYGSQTYRGKLMVIR